MFTARTRPSISPLPTLIVLLCLATPFLRAQEQRTDSSMVVVDSVEVNVVNVDVYVTRRGEAVPDLSPEDFEIFEDGEPVPLTNFAFVERTAPTTPISPPAEQQPQEPAEAVAVPEDPLHVVIYFDAVNIRPQNRNLLLSQMDTFLDSGLGPEDRVMVVTAGDGGLTVDLPFSQDRRALRATLEEIRKHSTQGSLADTERQRLLADLENADEDAMGDAMTQLEMAENAQRETARTTLNRLQYFVTALAGLPGRKAMLYISDGIAGTSDEDLGAFGRVAAAANANRVTFYGFDARGWRPDPSINPASRGGNMTELVNSSLNANVARPLHELSEATGGFAVTNTGNFDGALEKVSTDLASYYSLGYTPKSPDDGRYHRIKVKVKGRGFQVRYREGYLSRKAIDRLADRTLAALTFDTGANPLGVALRPTPVETAEDGSRRLPILVQFPVQGLTLIPNGEQFQGEVNLLILIQGLDGEMAPAQEVRLPISVTREQMESDTPTKMAYKLALPIVENGFKIAVGARDAVSSEESFATLQIGG